MLTLAYRISVLFMISVLCRKFHKNWGVFCEIQSALSISSEPRIALCYLTFIELNFRRLNLRACVSYKMPQQNAIKMLKSRVWIWSTDPWVESRVSFHCAILFLTAKSILKGLRTNYGHDDFTIGLLWNTTPHVDCYDDLWSAQHPFLWNHARFFRLLRPMRAQK